MNIAATPAAGIVLVVVHQIEILRVTWRKLPWEKLPVKLVSAIKKILFVK